MALLANLVFLGAANSARAQCARSRPDSGAPLVNRSPRGRIREDKSLYHDPLFREFLSLPEIDSSWRDMFRRDPSCAARLRAQGQPRGSACGLALAKPHGTEFELKKVLEMASGSPRSIAAKAHCSDGTPNAGKDLASGHNHVACRRMWL